MSLEKRNTPERNLRTGVETSPKREQITLPRLDASPVHTTALHEPTTSLATHWRTQRRNPKAGETPFSKSPFTPGWKVIGASLMTISAFLLVFTSGPAGPAALGFIVGLSVIFADLFGWTPK